MVVLTGARQTGKTTLARAVFPDMQYINLDAPEDRDHLRTISTASWGRTVGDAILDEAQKEPVVFEKVKYAFDEKGISFSLLLGSSQILLLKKIRESLAGRVSIYELWPLLLAEIHQKDFSPPPSWPLVDRFFGKEDLNRFLSKEPALLMEKEDAPRRETEEYLLQWGGMPALLPLSEQERWKWLKDYEYTYLERDLSDLARLDDLQPFSKFKKLAALRCGKLLNYSELARDTGVSVDTAQRYLEYLHLSYQTVLLQPYKRNLTSSAIKTPKLYWLDVGLMRQLSGRREEVQGEIYETMVVTELFKWIKTTQKLAEMYFYRTRSGLELDILLETGSGLIGLEVKSRKGLHSSDTRAMREVAKALGKEWRGGIVVYPGRELKKIDQPNIWAIPSRRLFI